MDAESALPRVVVSSLELVASIVQLPAPPTVQVREEEKYIWVLLLPVVCSSVEMTSLVFIAAGGVIRKVATVGLPFMRVVIELVMLKLLSSTVLVSCTSVAPDCSMGLPSLA